MWLILVVICIGLWYTEEKVKNKWVQFFSFIGLSLLFAATLALGPTWLENII